MHISILTLFPEMFTGPLGHSILKRAAEKNIVTIECVNLRDFATDKYKSADEHPYGGGKGMILRVDLIDQALKSIKSRVPGTNSKTILLDPKGTTYNQNKAEKFTKFDHLILVAGHYEGVDERIRKLVDEEISIGDYILTGGEIPALVVIDSVVRLLPEVLKPAATTIESFSLGLLEFPQYTRPRIYKKMKVPGILFSGNHAKIEKWRQNAAKRLTKTSRPDLLGKI